MIHHHGIVEILSVAGGGVGPDSASPSPVAITALQVACPPRKENEKRFYSCYFLGSIQGPL